MSIPLYPYQIIHLTDRQLPITIKRVDLVHPNISGNKWFKLKYNLQAAKSQGYNQIISFGGAYSNHIHALAHACQEQGLTSIGVIRGDELKHKPLNPTLTDARRLGMQFHFVSRQDYRCKSEDWFIAKLLKQYGSSYVIPEGGSNSLAVKGCAEMIEDYDRQFDLIVCAVGTGATLAGIINASSASQRVLGLSVLAGDFQQALIRQYTGKSNWQLLPSDTAYGKASPALLAFINHVEQAYDVPLDPIYTGKALYQLQSCLEQDKEMQSANILFIHTGGLQGRRGITTM